MAEFLTTRGISYHLELVIDQAVGQLTLISPFLRVPATLLDRMKATEQRGVRIHIVYGKEDLKQPERDKLRVLKNLTISYSEHLHAKCYVNEQAVIIGSMNLYDYSEFNNIELGVLLTPADGEIFAKAQQEVRRIVGSSVPEKLVSPVRGASSTARYPGRIRPGNCVRCKAEIPYRPQSPLCEPCYRSWATWGNDHYPEKYCHRCGQVADVAKARPLCYSCFRAEPFTSSAF